MRLTDGIRETLTTTRCGAYWAIVLMEVCGFFACEFPVAISFENDGVSKIVDGNVTQQDTGASTNVVRRELADKFSSRPVTIRGKIVGYKQIYKTGKFTYFDAVTRISKSEIFPINEKGQFEITFNTPHPLLGSAYFDIENRFYRNLFVEPGMNYQVKLEKGELQFQAESGIKNRSLNTYYAAFFKRFGHEIGKLKRLSGVSVTLAEFLAKHKQFEKKALEFVAEYEKEHAFSEQLSRLVRSEIRYKTARAWINARFDYSVQGTRTLRSDLPNWFYERLFEQYPLDDAADCQSRGAIDYLSNIVNVFSERPGPMSKVDFYEAQDFFTDAEMRLLERAVRGDAGVADTKQYKQFFQANRERIRSLEMRFRVKNVLDSIGSLRSNVARDLVISQAVSKFCIANNVTPSLAEWERIKSEISQPAVFQTLRDYQRDLSRRSRVEEKDALVNSMNVEQLKKKYIDEYRGSVIYFDVYSTWCGPCRQEIPFAKALHAEFADRDVVFVNLCAKSEEVDWKKLVKQYEIEGENFYLNNEEFSLLSKVFKVEGFPTYVLVDRNGVIVDYKAPSPSDRQDVMAKIEGLLSESSDR